MDGIPAVPAPTDPDGGRVVLPIEGMACASCVGRVEKGIRNVAGVVAVSVNLATDRAEVTYEQGRSDIAAVADAVFKAGHIPGSAARALLARRRSAPTIRSSKI